MMQQDTQRPQPQQQQSQNQRRKAERNPSRMFWNSSAKGTYRRANAPKPNASDTNTNQ